MFAKKILFLTEGRIESGETQILLQVLGYQVEIFRNLDLALKRYGSVLKTEEQFDLVLADVTPGRARFLEQMHLAGRIGRLILVQAELFCRDYYCIYGRIAVVCNLSALLKCMQKILPESHESGSFAESAVSAEVNDPLYCACA